MGWEGAGIWSQGSVEGKGLSRDWLGGGIRRGKGDEGKGRGREG